MKRIVSLLIISLLVPVNVLLAKENPKVDSLENALRINNKKPTVEQILIINKSQNLMLI
jgi:hypothetical protein